MNPFLRSKFDPPGPSTNLKMISFLEPQFISLSELLLLQVCLQVLASNFIHSVRRTSSKIVSFSKLNTNAKIYFTATKLTLVPANEDHISGPGIDKFNFLILIVQALPKIQEIKFFGFNFLILDLKLKRGTFQTDLPILHF